MISKILKQVLSAALLVFDGVLWHRSHAVQTVVKLVDATKLGLTKGLTAVAPLWVSYLTGKDAAVAAIDDGIENHHYSDHNTTTYHHPHPDNSSSPSTSPNYYPSNSHLVVFWGVVAHLVVFFLSLVYQCCMADANHRTTASSPLLSSSLLGNLDGADVDGIVVNDTNIHNNTTNINNDGDDNVYLSR